MILVAGPYRCGTSDEPVWIAKNVEYRRVAESAAERVCTIQERSGAKAKALDAYMHPLLANGWPRGARFWPLRIPMQDKDAPFHAHIYYRPATRAAAVALHERLSVAVSTGAPPALRYVGALRDRPVGPHPQPQFEVHFMRGDLQGIVALLKASGLTVLVHPVTLDDLADHTTLAQWIGKPLPLDLSTLDPPGVNQGLARFGLSDV